MKTLLNGESTKLKPHKHGTWLWNFECCDCSLTHLFLIEHLGKDELTVKAYRDEYYTEKARKKNK